MVGPTCLSCEAPCPKAGCDNLPDDADCYEGPISRDEAAVYVDGRDPLTVLSGRVDRMTLCLQEMHAALARFLGEAP